MPFPPIDKSFSGLIRDIAARVTLLERRRIVVPGRLSEYGEEVTDWNNVDTAGFYWSENVPNQATNTGLYAGIVSVNGNGSFNVRQRCWRIYIDGSVPDLRTWERNRSNGTWSPWVLTSAGKDATDTGWVTITNSVTLSTGLTWGGGSGLQARRIGAMASIRGDFLTAAAAGFVQIPTHGNMSNITLLTGVPIEYRPAGVSNVSLSAGPTGRNNSYLLSSSGALQLVAMIPDSTQTATIPSPAGEDWSFFGTYPI